MKIEELLPDSGRQTVDNAAKAIVRHPEYIPELIKIAFKDVYPISMRTANLLEKCDLLRPDIIQPYLKEIVRKLPKSNAEGVKRCLLKMLTRHTKIENEDILGIVMNCCFEWLVKSGEATAVKYNTMKILYDISQKYPELKIELIAAIEDQLPKTTTGTKNFGTKLLAKLYKETGK
jgi:hypothetical protein